MTIQTKRCDNCKRIKEIIFESQDICVCFNNSDTAIIIEKLSKENRELKEKIKQLQEE